MKSIAVLLLVAASPIAAIGQRSSPSPAPARATAAPRMTPANSTPANSPRVTTTPQPDTTPDLVTISGKRYKHARVGSHDPDGITYFYEGGAVKIPFTDLPEEIRKKYGYDPKEAAQFAAQDDAAQQRFAANAAAQNLALQQRENQTRQTEAADAERNKADAERNKKLADAKAHAKKFRIEIIQSVSDGVLADLLEQKYAVVEGDSVSSIGGGGGVSGGGSYYERSGKTIFVQGIPPTAEGEKLDVSAFQDGVFTYTDVQGAKRTVSNWILIK